MAVEVKECQTLTDFINRCKDVGAQLAKLTEYAFVEPGDLGEGAIGMVGKERLVVTAFLKDTGQLLRWQQTRNATSTVTVVAGAGRGFSSGGFGREANLIKGRLEIEGIQIVNGEWSKEELESILGYFD